MINDTSQRSIAKWFRCGATFNHCFSTNLLLSLVTKFLDINVLKTSWYSVVVTYFPDAMIL